MKNEGRGVQFFKLRVKTTGTCQPCDVREGFKTMKVACKKTIATIDDAALEQSVKQRRTHLGNQGRSLLDGCYLDAMVGCIATTSNKIHMKHDWNRPMEDNNTESGVATRPSSERTINDAKYLPQEDNTQYSLRELVWHMCDYAIESPVFKLPVDFSFDLVKSSSTFTVTCIYNPYRRRLLSEKRTENALH
jgi:hypothetical protein